MRRVIAVAVRAALLAGVWLLLSRGAADYLAYGAVSVAGATALSLALLPPGPLEARSLPRRAAAAASLAAWFLGQTVIGGVDVARRAVRRVPDVEPAVVTAPLILPEGSRRRLALLLMNLMPGSMVQRIREGGSPADGPARGDGPAGGDVVELHTLSPALDPAGQWEALQRRVERLGA